MPFVCGAASLGLFLLLHGTSKAEATLLLSESIYSDLLPLLRGVACAGPVLSTMSMASPGPSLLLHSVSQADSAPFAPSSVQMDSPPLLRGSSCAGSVLFALDTAHTGFLLPVRSLARVDKFSPAFGLAHLEPFVLILNSVGMGLPASSQSCARLGLLSFVVGVAGLDLSPSLKGFA